ncbi:5710_t:CDS:2 [Ambispora gerdemannii]|uniref:5710_t:CDS:1 n=1 Tax=Ambispora gerdemannii TaxID=144530 RepID=A0A9N9CYJ7_9GLOM|nr:5710_t:CDS:2 [Ambispora gerdemannii]
MVVTIPEKPLELHLRRKILLAYDNSEYSKFVYQYCLDNLFIPNRDHVSLVTVLDEEQSIFLMAHKSRAQSAENRKRNRRLSFTENQEASDILRPLAEELSSKGITSNVYTLKGDPKYQLLKLADNSHADLFVVGTRGLGLLKRNLLGSVSEHVVRHASIPVFVVKDKTRDNSSQPSSPTSNSFSSNARRSLQAPISIFRTLTK